MPRIEPASPDGPPASAASTRSATRAERVRASSDDPPDYRPYPTAPTRTRRSPASSTGPSAARPRRPPTPATIWFTPNPEPVPTGPASTDGNRGSAWPPAVLTAIVTSFSRVADRVLLMPWPGPPDATPPTAPRSLITDAARSADPGLNEAAAVVTRRERHVDSLPVGPGRPTSPPNPAGSEAPRVDLAITVMPGRTEVDEPADALARLAARSLRLGGILAVLTHCHWGEGELTDPTGPMVTAAQNADLLYLQHIVAVHLSPTDPRLRATPPITLAPVALAAPVHRRVHSDVLVFAQPHDYGTGVAARPGAGEEGHS